VKRASLAVLAMLWVATGSAEEPKPSPPANGARIAVEPPSFDFGKAVQNKTLQKEFTIRNYGTEDLTIENVSTTCGCTAALTENKTVKPGGSTPLRVSLQTRNYNGKVVRKVLVRSNDPGKALLEVQVEANVVSP
jgi:hypothetical protein